MYFVVISANRKCMQNCIIFAQLSAFAGANEIKKKTHAALHCIKHEIALKSLKDNDHCQQLTSFRLFHCTRAKHAYAKTQRRVLFCHTATALLVSEAGTERTAAYASHCNSNRATLLCSADEFVCKHFIVEQI